MFIRGFSELRGSFDRNRNLLSMDYVKNSQAETKRVRLLIDNLNIPVHVVNYNFREFQPDFQKGRKRETQLRYNIFWYAQNIGFINEYRIAAFKENFYYTNIRKDGDVTYFDCPQPLKSDNTTFENRIAYYSHNVFGKKLTSNDMSKFKELIGANDTQSEFRRDASIVNTMPDKNNTNLAKTPLFTRFFANSRTMYVRYYRSRLCNKSSKISAFLLQASLTACF